MGLSKSGDGSLRRARMIIDAQVHIWAADRPSRRWVAGATTSTHRPGPFTAQDLIREMAGAGVSRAILVPPSWEGYRNDVALLAARRFPEKFAVMGRIDLRRPQSRTRLSRWRKQQGMLGVRLTFHREPERRWLTDGTADWFWDAAEAAGLPVMVFVPGQLPALDRIASRHPDLKLIVD